MAGRTVSDTFSVHESMIKAFEDFELKIDREIASNVLADPKPIGINYILEKYFDIRNSELAEKFMIRLKFI